jgi:bacteriocin-like protein
MLGVISNNKEEIMMKETTEKTGALGGEAAEFSKELSEEDLALVSGGDGPTSETGPTGPTGGTGSRN